MDLLCFQDLLQSKHKPNVHGQHLQGGNAQQVHDSTDAFAAPWRLSERRMYSFVQQNGNLAQLLPTNSMAGGLNRMQHSDMSSVAKSQNDAATHSQQHQSYKSSTQMQAQQTRAQAASGKDARVTKDGTLALTRPQINVANRILTTK